MAKSDVQALQLSVLLEQWLAGAVAALAMAFLTAGLRRTALLLCFAALGCEAAALASLALQRYLGMGPAKLAVIVTPGSIRLGIVNVELQPDSFIFKMAALPLPLLLTGFAASELSLLLQPLAFRVQLCAAGMALAARCAEAQEWDRESAAAGARGVALQRLDDFFSNLQRKKREEQAPEQIAESSASTLKLLIDAVINRVSIEAKDFSLALEAHRFQGEADERHENFLALVKVGLFHVPAALPEEDPQPLCEAVSEDGCTFCPRIQRDIEIEQFVLNVIGASGTGIRTDQGSSSSSSTQPQQDMFGSMPPMRLRLAMPPALSELLSGRRQPRRRISADLGGEGVGACCANEALMKVVWTLLGRYLAASNWVFELQQAELRCAGGAKQAAEGQSLEPRSLSDDDRRGLLSLLSEKPWAALRKELQGGESAFAGCSYYDLLALRLQAAGHQVGEDWEKSAMALWRQAEGTMKAYYKEESLFHELHVSMGLSLDIDVEMGAARIQADLGRLYARLGPKGTEAGIEVVNGMAVDGRPRQWTEGLQGQSPSSLAQQVLVRGGSFLPQEASPGLSEESGPAMRLAAFLPAEPTGMQLTVLLNGARARLLPSPLLGVVLPAVLGLLEQDPRPPAPQLPEWSPYLEEPPVQQESPLPDTLLGGWQVRLNLDVQRSGAVLPLKPQMPMRTEGDADMGTSLDHDMDGLGVCAEAIYATVSSCLSEESLQLAVDGASVVAPGGYKVLEPMCRVQLGYSSKRNPSGGPLRSVNVAMPMASLSVSLAVMQVAKKSATTLMAGFDSGKQAEEEGQSQTKEIHRVQQLFEAIDTDKSGELDRNEVFVRLMETLCVDNYTLTNQELVQSFDEIWTTMDTSNDGKVSFEEFCHAVQGYLDRTSGRPSNDSSTSERRQLKQNFGSLSLAACELGSCDAAERIGSDEGLLWRYLEDEAGILPEIGGGSNSSALTIQWKLLRSLRHFSDAQSWWESHVRHKVAPEAAWEIEPDRPVWSAHQLILAAFSGHLLHLTEEVKSSAAGTDAPAAKYRSGVALEMCCEGFQIGLEDPLSQLRGQRRLSLGAGYTEKQRRSCEMILREDSTASMSALRTQTYNALDLKVTYWHTQGQKLLAFDDDLTATAAVRGFFGSCMNPFRKDPEYFMEPWGFDMFVNSQADDKALTVRFIADTHFVTNVTSSLLLGIKPIVQTLMPPEEPEALSGDSACQGTAPLAHLLHGLRMLDHKTLQDFKLLLDGAVGVGSSVPREERVLLHDFQQLDIRGQKAKKAAKWQLRFQLPNNTNLSRIMLSEGWRVTALGESECPTSTNQTEPMIQLFVETDRESAPPEIQDVTAWAVGWSSSAEGSIRDRAARGSELPRTQEESPTSPVMETTGCQSSRELEVKNCCGVLGRLWFEIGRGHTENFTQVPKDKTIVCKVPEVDCTLCIGPADQTSVARPDLSTFGRYGAPLKWDLDLGAEKAKCCVSASLSIGPRGQALLELLPPLELQNATQLPLRLRLQPPHGAQSFAASMGVGGFGRQAAQMATEATAPNVAVVPPGGTYQVPLHVLQAGNSAEHFWQVLAEAAPQHNGPSSLAFAFLLGGDVLKVGRKELELRRSLCLALETTSVASSDPECKATLQRYTLLLLPGLRVVNSLPVAMRVTVLQKAVRDELWDLEPGGIADFGRMPFGCQLLLTVEGASARVDVTAESLNSRAKFKELKVDNLKLSPNMMCSLQSRWQAGAGPEIVVLGRCIMFNKTGLPLQFCDSEARGEAPGTLDPGAVAALRTQVEVRVGLGQSQASDASAERLPSQSGTLHLQVAADAKDNSKLFDWVAHKVALNEGTLSLEMEERTSTGATAYWPLSPHSTVTAMEPHLTGGEEECFSLQDPGRGQSLLLRASSQQAKQQWLSQLQRSVQLLREVSLDETTKGWDPECGPCRRGQVPVGLFNMWCSEGIPVQAPNEGEVTICSNTQPPAVMFLGVQVHPLLGLRTQSKGVTVTPRFIVRNTSTSFIQVMPALLPQNEAKWPDVTNRIKDILKEFEGRKDNELLSVTDFLTHDQKEAVWIPPGESLALFHFPIPDRCQTDVKKARKAVALRLAGREPLQMILASSERPIILDRVITSGFTPYRDSRSQSLQLGRLPSRLRVLAKEGRLLCLRGRRHEDFRLGKIILSKTSEVFIGVPIHVNPAQWLKEGAWEKLQETVDLRAKGHKEVSMQFFTCQLQAGSICLDGAGEGSIAFLARSIGSSSSADVSAIGEPAGLPWSGWLSLDSTSEEVVALRCSAGASGDEPGTSFLRYSVQVRNSTAFMVLSDEPPPYRVENWSPSRTLAVRFKDSAQCEILPPLTWWAFAWPLHAQHDKRLILQDLWTDRKQMYEADKVGPGLALKLDEGEEVTAASAPLSEEGFHDVVLMQESKSMEEYVWRVAKDLDSQCAEAAVMEFAQQQSGEGATSSLRHMRQEMIIKGVVGEPKRPMLTEAGRRRAMMCPHMMAVFIKELLGSCGLAADDGDVAAFVARSSRLPALSQLLEELPAMSWARSVRTLAQAYEDLLAQRDNVDETANVLHLLLRRALLQLENEQPKLAASLKSAGLESLSRSLARQLRSGQGARSWAELMDQAKQCMPQSRRGTLDSAQGSDDETALPEEDEEPAELLRSNSALSEGRRSDAPFAEDATVGMSEPLTQEGYQNVQSLLSENAMAAFVRKLLVEQGGEVLSQEGLVEFARGCLDDSTPFPRVQEELLQGPKWAGFRKTGRGKLFVDRWFDGVSKVFSARESRHHLMAASTERSSAHFDCWDLDLQLAGAHICFVFQAKPHSLGTGGELDARNGDEEFFGVTVDHIQLRKKSSQRRVQFFVHHFQIDNMREVDRVRPIIICPEDSGYYSDRRERHHKKRKDKHSTEADTIPFVYFCMEKLPSGILHFKELELLLQPVIMRLDVGFWIQIVQQLMEWANVGNSSAAEAAGTSEEDREIVAKQVLSMREGGIDLPASTTTLRPIYLEWFRLGALIAQVEILMPMKMKILMQGKAASGSDSASSTLEDTDDQQDAQWQSLWLARILARLTHRSHGYMKQVFMVAQKGLVFVITSVGSGVLSGVGHITPRFSFPETVFQRTFQDLTPFAESLVRDYVKTGMYQFWKVLFSINLLGDPIGLGTSVAGGVVQFFRKTGSEVIAGDLKGEGLLSLAQGVLGGTAATAGKFFGALGDTIDALAQTGDQNPNFQLSTVNHVGDGITAGAQVFIHNTASGIAGLVQAPVQGFQRKGVVGLGQGLLKGMRGVVAKPVSGLMHGVQHIAEGVDATTRLWDHWEQIVPRRASRPLPKGSKLLPLVGAEFSPRITVYVESLQFLNLESFTGVSAALSQRLRGATYRVELSTVSTGTWAKASKLGRLAKDGSVVFNEVKWVPTQTLMESDILIEVQDCALSGDPTRPKPVYRAVLPRAPHGSSVLQQVAKLMREPKELATLDGFTCRIRPSQPFRVSLNSIDGASPAELLLRFWPAWDPERVPMTQRWVPKTINSPTGEHLPPPQRKEGALEKRSKGAFHHWSLKWVVLDNHQFTYWNDRKDFEDGRQPKVRYHLSDPKCIYRFAAGEAPEACFAQVRADGLLEAQWRPAHNERETAGNWLQAVLRHTLQE